MLADVAAVAAVDIIFEGRLCPVGNDDDDGTEVAFATADAAAAAAAAAVATAWSLEEGCECDGWFERC